MTEKRVKTKKKKEEFKTPEEEKPSKLQYDVAKYLRRTLPEKKTTMLGHKVDYFIASKAIDALLESNWAKATGESTIFPSRESVIDFMDDLLRHKLFHRARKIIVKPEDKKTKKTDQEVEVSAAEEKKDKPKKEKGKKTDSTEKESDEKVEKKKEKKKVKFDMHLTQIFVDGNEPYIWIYDPVPLKTWFIGMGLVIGAIAVCLFPLWPRIVRTWVYYLSIAAAGFLFFIIGLAVVRFIVFCLVWLTTFGKHHFWLLPNLTEDVGFFASFWPLYQYEYKGDENESDKQKKEKKKSKAKDSDAEEQDGRDKDNDDKETPSIENKEGSESGDNSGNSRNGSENGFEILDSNDLANETGSDDGSQKKDR
ncbi:Translocation protein SEC62 [Halotydeus destructor]|nr:Translocation protein SEC62 [Halotydeus destructor]